jgi:serine/threonine protein phosphatase PrpC
LDSNGLGPSVAALPFSIATWGETDTGCLRETNEDNFAALDHLGLFMVADGMGGAAGGEVASRMVIENVQRAVEDGETTFTPDTTLSPESGPRRFIAGIHRSNRLIFRRSCQDWRTRGMGTTFVGLLLLPRCAVIAHVGDSRVYRLRAGELTLMTHDHSLANELIARGHLKPEHVATFPRRNVITRAVGTHESVDVDAKIVDVRAGDVFLLCSDGLHGELTDAEIGDILRDSARPAEAACRLVERALVNGGRDNITAVVVLLDPIYQEA